MCQFTYNFRNFTENPKRTRFLAQLDLWPTRGFLAKQEPANYQTLHSPSNDNGKASTTSKRFLVIKDTVVVVQEPELKVGVKSGMTRGDALIKTIEKKGIVDTTMCSVDKDCRGPEELKSGLELLRCTCTILDESFCVSFVDIKSASSSNDSYHVVQLPVIGSSVVSKPTDLACVLDH